MIWKTKQHQNWKYNKCWKYWDELMKWDFVWEMAFFQQILAYSISTPVKKTHLVCYDGDSYFDSYGWPPSRKSLITIFKKHGKCICSDYQIQKNDSLCASYVLYVIYLTKMLGIDFKSAVLNLYYQMIPERWRFL